MVIRLASYNTALSRPHVGALKAAIARQDDPQVNAILSVIKHINADLLLLNEVDYDACPSLVKQLSDQYPYAFYRPVNTGIPSGRDFDKDGIVSNKGADALGFGWFPGQYGMLFVSRFPILDKPSRTFQHFLWRDMPNAKLPQKQDASPWFDEMDLAVLPLSSKSHWDLVVQLDDRQLHCLCSHPTPPVFDGQERRNACRNHDEIRFWQDYLSGEPYMYDDQGVLGGFAGGEFVLMGDLNASPFSGDAFQEAITQLLTHPSMLSLPFPESEGARQHSSHQAYSEYHTADWRMMADYVRPSSGLTFVNQGVFWPSREDPLISLLQDTSDHRLVYIDLDY
ncbi:endonuclease/exonuclease/phosphatase family protein [Marinomonas epiphytica]